MRGLPPWLGWAVLAVAAAAHLATVAVWPKAYFHLIDLEVYRDGVLTVFRDAPLYAQGVTGELKFVYPPFAALLFAPLAWFDMDVLRHLWTALTVALLAAVVWWSWRRLSGTRRVALPAVALLVGAAFWLDPVRVTAYLGQINVVLMALVAWDVLRGDGKRWQGVGVGIAAAVKLTPLLFIGYLLLTRRFRAAGVAVATFAAAAGAGFALLPGDSRSFWLDGVFGQISRINPVDAPSNHSLRGLVARTLDGAAVEVVVWGLASAALLVVVAHVVRRARRQGEEVLALALTGMACAAVSPFSWTHHWVWLVPFLVHCAYAALVRRDRLAAVVAAGTFLLALGYLTGYPDPASGLIPPSSIAALEVDGAARFLVGNVYVLLLVALIALSHWMLTRQVRDMERDFAPVH